VPEPVDDVSIGDDERLLHRIRPVDVVLDSETGQRRPASSSFRSKSNIISVDLASLTTPEKSLANYLHHALVEIEVGTVRSLGCKVVRDPLPDNPSHALLYGSGPEGRMTKSQAREIVSRCKWVSVGDVS
jgi:hypothetical protein